MEMDIKMLETILFYLQERSCHNACRIPDIKKMAQDLNLRPGKLKAALYYLCGEGILLQQGELILIVEEL